MIPNRVSSSEWFEMVQFQTAPVNAARVGSVTELKRSTDPIELGGTISPELPAGADWKLRP